MGKVTIITDTEEIVEKVVRGVSSKFEELKNHLQPQLVEETYLTINQVAVKFSVSKVTINNWQRNGTLKPYQLAGRIYFKLSDIEKSLIQISA